MSEYAVLGDPELCGAIRKALSKHPGMTVLNDDELEIQDEWSARRWFSRNTPDGVFMCVGMTGQNSVQNFSFTLGGTYNVLRAALGNTKRLLLVTPFLTQEFFLMARLADLYRFEKNVEYASLVKDTREQPVAFAERCVLVMRDVSAKEAHKGSSEGADERREVRDQVLSESQGDKQHGSAAQSVLEVPLTASAGKAPGDLRPERAPAESQEAQGANHNNPGSV